MHLTSCLSAKANVELDVLRSLSGLVSWSMALINFIVDELFTIVNHLKEHGSMDQTFLDSKSTHHFLRYPPIVIS